MDQSNANSSTTILLVICVAVLAIIGIGWFALDSQTPAPASPVAQIDTQTAAVTADTPLADDKQSADADTDVAGDVIGGSEGAGLSDSETPATAASANESPAESNIDVDLRKARMAAEAEILVEPRNQSALYFYGRVLGAEPNHRIANAELDAVLGQLAVTAADHLAAERFAAAFELSEQVAQVRPDHALVNNVQQTIDQLSGRLVTEAMSVAETGEPDDAEALLKEAEALPGRSAAYFQAVRDSMSDLQQAQQAQEAAAAERLESERATAARATRAWMEKVRGAIAAGQLVAPAEESALAYLNERGVDSDIGEQLRKELASAVLAEVSAHIDSGDLENAESLIAAGRAVPKTAASFDDLQTALEGAYLARESARVVATTELVRRNSVPPRYPRRAAERGISGWVEVGFTVTSTGETSEVAVLDSEPDNTFDAPAIAAVEQWLFEPREFRGQTIAQRAAVRLVFTVD